MVVQSNPDNRTEVKESEERTKRERDKKQTPPSKNSALSDTKLQTDIN